MGTFADIVINDAQGTPIAHTFAKASRNEDYARWEDRAVSIYLGFNRVILQLKRPSAPDGRTNVIVTLKVEMPVLETVGNNSNGVTPPQNVAYVLRSECKFTLPVRSIEVDRNTLRVFTAALLGSSQTQIADAVGKFIMPN